MRLTDLSTEADFRQPAVAHGARSLLALRGSSSANTYVAMNKIVAICRTYKVSASDISRRKWDSAAIA